MSDDRSDVSMKSVNHYGQGFYSQRNNYFLLLDDKSYVTVIYS